jgi:hypothetical protein
MVEHWRLRDLWDVHLNGARAPAQSREVARLTQYKIFRVDDANRILARQYPTLRDDLSALYLAAKLAAKTGCEVEIWDEQRFVARVDRDGRASTQRTTPDRLETSTVGMPLSFGWVSKNR